MQVVSQTVYRGHNILVMSTGHVFIALDGNLGELYPAENEGEARRMIDEREDQA